MKTKKDLLLKNIEALDIPHEQKREMLKTPVSKLHQMMYYVYTATVEGEVKYIGYGKGGRYKHCLSGKSSCSELNKDFHAGRYIEVHKVSEGLTKSDAINQEYDLIVSYKDAGIYNKLITTKAAQKPNLTNVQGLDLTSVRDFNVFAKQLAKLSPDVNKYDFENLKYWMNRCGLQLYIADIGSKKALVVDKISDSGIDIYHSGCANWPNCEEFGCGS